MAPAPQDPAWYDRQYDNRARVPGALAILRRWAEDSARARATHDVALDVAYGAAPADRLDVFRPRPGVTPAPVLVHLHGGYWRALSKADHSFIAPPFVRAGAMVVVCGYALCPRVSIGDIVNQLRGALAWTWRHAAEHGGDPARIVVTGHSAGGHLAASLLATDWPAHAADLPPRLVRAAVAISGVFDLEPLRHAPFLAPDLRLDADSARRWSPVYARPPQGPLHAFVGGNESEEFLRQNASIRAAWGAKAVPTCKALAGFNHLDVLDTLVADDGAPHQVAVDALRARR